MGMSAGQARLLSITAKLTDNELRSQMLTNSKLHFNLCRFEKSVCDGKHSRTGVGSRQ